MSMNVSVRRIVRPGEEGNKNGKNLLVVLLANLGKHTQSPPPLPMPLPMPSASLAFVPSTSQASESKANKRAADRGSHPFHAAPDEGGRSPRRKELGKSQARSSFPSLFCLFPPSSPFLSGSNISPEVVGGKAFFRLFHFRSTAAAEGQWKPPRAAM